MYERRTWMRKLIPILTAQSFDREAVAFKKFQRERIHGSGWTTPGAEGSELIFPESIKN
jgi:hypothetical protein